WRRGVDRSQGRGPVLAGHRGASSGRERGLARSRRRGAAARHARQSDRSRGARRGCRTGLKARPAYSPKEEPKETMIPAVILILVVAFLYSAVRILREYERGVVFTLGRYTGTKGPGLFLLVPIVQQMVRIDLRVVVDEVPPQDVISRDNVSVKVNAVIYF